MKKSKLLMVGLIALLMVGGLFVLVSCKICSEGGDCYADSSGTQVECNTQGCAVYDSSKVMPIVIAGSGKVTCDCK
jgi:hypothetical protein